MKEIYKEYNMECGNLKVDIACVKKKQDGFIGVDLSEDESHADIIHDLRKGLPFCNNSCSEIKAHNIMEHFTNDEFIEVMWDCWRCLKHEGRIDILVPHGFNESHIKDPTHRHNGFCQKTFSYFEAGSHRQKQYKLPPFKSETVQRNGNTIQAYLRAIKK